MVLHRAQVNSDCVHSGVWLWAVGGGGRADVGVGLGALMRWALVCHDLMTGMRRPAPSMGSLLCHLDVLVVN